MSETKHLKRSAVGEVEVHVGDHSQVTTQSLRLSFVSLADSFVNIKWSEVHSSLNSLSDKWEFMAFGSDHRSAIITTNDPKVSNEFQSYNTIQIQGIDKLISIEILKGSNSRGIIFNKFLIPLLDVEIFNELSSQGVTDIYRIQKIYIDNGPRQYTGSVILNFKNHNIPAHVFISGVRIPVNKLAPRPMLCLHCGLIGHTVRRCKNLSVNNCSTCFFNHTIETDCNQLCKNCKGDHFSNDPICQAIKKEVKILKIKESHDVNYFDAKIIADSLFGSNQSGDVCDQDNCVEKMRNLIKKNKDYFNELKLIREEKDKICENLKRSERENRELKEVTIPDLNDKFQRIKNDYESKIKSMTDMMNVHIAESSTSVENLTDINLELKEENFNITKKNERLEEIKNTFEDFFNLFTTSSTVISDALKNFSLANKDHPFLERTF